MPIYWDVKVSKTVRMCWKECTEVEHSTDRDLK